MTDPALDPERIDYIALWNITDDQYLIMASEDFVVFLDGELDLDWQLSKKFTKEISTDVKLHAAMNEVLNRVAILQSYPTSRLEPRQKKDFYRMIGEGLARAFSRDTQRAMEMLAQAGEFAKARNQELARVWYLTSTGTTTLVFTIVLAIFSVFHKRLIFLLG